MEFSGINMGINMREIILYFKYRHYYIEFELSFFFVDWVVRVGFIERHWIDRLL